MDRDGLEDVVASGLGGLTVLRGVGARSFDEPRTVSVGEKIAAFALGDLDGDGLPDVAFPRLSGGMSVLRNLGALEFDAPSSHLAGLSLFGLRLADLDANGANDLVATYEQGAAILLGHGSGPPPFRRGDSNADGHVDIADAVHTLGYLFLGSTSPLDCHDAADATDDGTLNLTDAIATLGYLFLGGAALPSPGPDDCGPDPTADQLPACVYSPATCGA
jgi:hypothetical protein